MQITRGEQYAITFTIVAIEIVRRLERTLQYGNAKDFSITAIAPYPFLDHLGLSITIAATQAATERFMELLGNRDYNVYRRVHRFDKAEGFGDNEPKLRLSIIDVLSNEQTWRDYR